LAKISYGQLTEYIVENQEKFYRLAYGYLSNREEALDAVQNAVCKALEHYDSLRNAEAVRSWFYRILVNACMDMLRSRGKLIYMPTESLEETPYEDPFPQDETLGKRVDALPTVMQTVIRLRFYEEFSLEEISRTTGWNINTVKTRLYGGLKKLKMTLEGEECRE
jgi:RNA polymerase sigma-70 factor, ECF subfamily